MRRWTTMRRHMVVLCAMLALVLQAVLGAAAMAAPQGPVLDIFGNPLCITGPDVNHGGDAPMGGHVGACCLTACMAVALPAPAGETVRAPRSVIDARRATPLPVFDIAAPAHDPGRPRAPPQA